MPRRNDITIRSVAIAVSIGVALSLAASAYAQVDCVVPKIIRVSQVRGDVSDLYGAQLPGASITLSRGGEAPSTTKTDNSGNFFISTAEGEYSAKISASGFDPLHVQLRVRREFPAFTHGSHLHVALSIGHMSCPWATTSTREFQRNLIQTQDLLKANATQK